MQSKRRIFIIVDPDDEHHFILFYANNCILSFYSKSFSMNYFRVYFKYKLENFLDFYILGNLIIKYAPLLY